MMKYPASARKHRIDDWSAAAVSVLVVVLLVSASACGRKKPQVTVPAPPAIGSTETGIASWYGHPYHGRRTASGETYDMEQLTAAHRTLPFDTWVRVHNLTNDREIDVRINDRGPFVKGRIIDLSRAAARAINMIGPGTARVRLQILAPPDSSPREQNTEEHTFVTQIGAFVERSRAERLRDAADRRFPPARIVARDGDPVLWRVIVGSPMTLQEAIRFTERIERSFGPAFVVRQDQVESNPVQEH